MRVGCPARQADRVYKRDESRRPCLLACARPRLERSADLTVSNASGADLAWSATDQRAVDLIRVLAMDAVEQAGSGHPGTAMSLTPAAYLLFQQILRHDPADPGWLCRDRFVLSCGHSSLTLYLQLYLSGYGLTLDDIKGYRSWGSLTPGHPEHGLTPGVETTTGPLGQGLGNAVGMAMAARRERGLLDPGAPAGTSPFDHHVYCFVSDGDIEEGISHEASALAAHQDLGNLVVLYDNNTISIEDDTAIAKSEDVCARYEAYGWHVQRVTWRHPDGYREDVGALRAAMTAARGHTRRPSLISLRTIIAWPAPTKQNTGEAHGSALGAEEVAATKRILGFDPDVSFPAEEETVAHARMVADRAKRVRAEWEETFAAWAAASPERAELLARLSARRLPDGWAAVLPEFPADAKGMATRKASGEILTALAPVLPELWGGSADLAGSNNTTMKGEPSFIPPEHQTRLFPGGMYGRTLHFGIREHAMGAICSAIPLQIAPMACSRMPKCSVRPYMPPGNRRVWCSGGMNEGSPFIVVLLLPARSAEPPHSSGSTGASAVRISPEAFRVAIPLASAGNSGSTAAQPSGNRRADSRASSSARSGLAAAQAANVSSHSARTRLARSATMRACATVSSSAGNDTSGSNPRLRLVAATSSAPRAEPCASPVFCLVGAGQAMIVRRAMRDGWLGVSRAAIRASRSGPTSSR